MDTTLQCDKTGAMVNSAFDTPMAARPARIVQVALRLWF